MGCKNTKIVGIPGSLPLDEFPVEIIYKILDELDICTIFRSLYHVCKRFDKILSSYDQYHLNLKLISLKKFDFICSRIRSEQITELTLSDDETSPGLVELFLKRFSMNTFIRLRSLSLTQINNEEFINQILIPIADHTSLLNFSSIKIINDDEIYSDTFVELLMSILAKPSLRKAYFDLSYNRTTSNPLPWLETCSIRHMTFIGTCTINFVRNTFTHAPQLETFITDDFDFYEENDLNDVQNNQENDTNSENSVEDELEIEENINNDENQLPKKEKFTSIESTNQLRSLTLSSCTFSMSKLEWVLQEITTLKQFSLITTAGYDDESILDGHRWEILVTDIDKLKFVFSVTMLDLLLWDIDACITKFQTPFWIEQKQWFVSLEKYDDTVILYTLPYIDNNYVMKNESSSFEYRSTASQNSTLQIQAMQNVRDLYIDTSETFKCEIQNLTVPRFFHVTHLILHGKWSRSKSFLTDMRTIVDLNSVEELTRDECIPTIDFIALLNLIPNLQSIRTTTNFLDALNAAKFCHTKCLRSFIVDPNHYGIQRAVNIEPFCAMFPRIEHLNIPVDSIESCQYTLDQLNQDLISVMFQIPENESSIDADDSEDEDDDDNEENATIDLFSEWIKELPEQYRYHKKQRHIHISLK